MATEVNARRYDRAEFDRLVMQRDLEEEIRRRRQHRAEADGQKSDGESEPTAE